MFISTFNGSFLSGQRPGAVGSVAALPNLNIWYDGADSTVFQPNASDGTLMSQWNDKSTAGTAHNAAAQGGNSGNPTIKTNIQIYLVALINKYPLMVLNFLQTTIS